MEKLIRRFKIWKRGPRAVNDHATHIPALMTLGLLMEVRSVLEFGSGAFSTLTFLNREVFPNLETLHSYENDPDWYTKVKEQTNPDPRITLMCVDGPLHALVPSLDLSAYDIIFIDDARTAILRSETIKAVVHHRHPRNVVVIHDFEVEIYQRAAEGVSNVFRMTAFNPNTGILWDGDKLQKRQLHSANRLIRPHASQWNPADTKKWHEALLQLINKRRK